MEEENILDQLQQHARDSPLFELGQSDVPVVVAVLSIASVSSGVSSHITKLQAIEADARATLASWNESIIGSILLVKRLASKIMADSDDSDDGKDVPEVPPFDPAQRRRSKPPIYHPGFQQAENDVKSVLRIFMEFLECATSSSAGGEEA